jgi:hypothetical protein
MRDILEQFVVRTANRMLRRRELRPADGPGVLLGYSASDTGAPGPAVRLADSSRPEHIAILGKTGQGKSSLIRVLLADDARRDHGAVVIDLHGDTAPYFLGVLAEEETRRHKDLTDRIILIDPSDADAVVGMNILEARGDAERFVQVAEVAQLLKQRWDLATFGPRTEELLRNALFSLSSAGQPLVELPPFLTQPTFRSTCLRHVDNPDVRAYFRDRYDSLSEAMQNVTNGAVLNKVTAFTTDPHFRHILGQRGHGIDLVDALDRRCWLVVSLPKGRLGEHAATLGSLFLTYLKRALFARRSRRLVSVYADELQNLVEMTTGIDTLLAEARKFGIGIVSANQFIDQYPPAMRSAVMSVGTHIFFQLSAVDAERANALLDGGRPIQHLLKELPGRTAIFRRGGQKWKQFNVLPVEAVSRDTDDLRMRVLGRWARRRTDIEAEIRERQRTEALAKLVSRNRRK